MYLSIYLNPARVSTANFSRSEAVKFPKFQAMEQNTSKSSAWAKKAKEGAQIGWPLLCSFFWEVFLSKILGKPTWKVKHQKSESNLGSRLGCKTALFQWKKTEGSWDNWGGNSLLLASIRRSAQNPGHGVPPVVFTIYTPTLTSSMYLP